MSFTHANSNRDLWALLAALLAVFAALVWRPRRRDAAQAPPEETATPDADPTPEPRR